MSDRLIPFLSQIRENRLKFLGFISNWEAYANVGSGLHVGKHFACFKTASLVFRLDLLPPRYLSANTDDNEVRLHKHLHTQTLPKDGRSQKGKKSSKQIVKTIAETGILCSVTLPRRH